MKTLNFTCGRVLGVLIEKQYHTPELYPLTLNSCTNACNQKTSREPVCQLGEDEVRQALEHLQDMHLIHRYHTAGSRTEKFSQNASAQLNLGHEATAIVSLLLLRGPQTPGELSTRIKRSLPDLGTEQLQAELEGLGARNPALVQKLERQPGQKENRWHTTLIELPADVASRPLVAPSAMGESTSVVEELEWLKSEVKDLRDELRALKMQLGVTSEPGQGR